MGSLNSEIDIYLKLGPEKGLPGGSDSKEFANTGDRGLIPGLGRSPGEGNGNSLQYSCLENSMDRKAWQTTVHGVAKSRTQLSYKHTPRFRKSKKRSEFNLADCS